VTRRFISVLISLPLLLPGCANDAAPSTNAAASNALTHDEYEQIFRTELAIAEAHADPGGTFGNADSSAEFAKAMQTVAESTKTLRARLSLLRPPTDISKAHTGFLEVLKVSARQIDRIAAYADRHSIEQVDRRYGPIALAKALTTRKSTAKRAAFIQAIKDGGYDLGLAEGALGGVPGQTPSG